MKRRSAAAMVPHRYGTRQRTKRARAANGAATSSSVSASSPPERRRAAAAQSSPLSPMSAAGALSKLWGRAPAPSLHTPKAKSPPNYPLASPTTSGAANSLVSFQHPDFRMALVNMPEKYQLPERRGDATSVPFLPLDERSPTKSEDEDEEFLGEKPIRHTAPRKPLSSYMLFVADHRDQINRENPTASFTEVGRLLGMAWKDLGQQEKSRYAELAREEKVRFEQDLAAAPPEFAKQEKVKKPLSSFMHFVAEHREQIQADHPGVKFADLGKLIGEKWQALDDASRKKFDELAALDRVRYKDAKAAASKSSGRGSKPKYALTGYHVFLEQQKGEIRRAHPNLPPPRLAKIAGQKWKQLSAQERTHYQQQAKAHRAAAEDEAEEPQQTA